MGAASEILGNSGAAHQLEYNGKTYPVSLIDQRVQSAFEKRLFEKACSAVAIQRDGGLLTEEHYAARLDELAAEFEEGGYAILSPRGLKTLQTPAGVQLLMSLLIGCTQAEFVPILMARKTEITSLIRLVIRESFPGVKLDGEPATAAPGEASGATVAQGSASAPN